MLLTQLSWNIPVKQEKGSRFTYDHICCWLARILVDNHCTVPGWSSSCKMKYWNTRLKLIGKFSTAVHFYIKVIRFIIIVILCFLLYVVQNRYFEKDSILYAKSSHGIRRLEMNVSIPLWHTLHLYVNNDFKQHIKVHYMSNVYINMCFDAYWHVVIVLYLQTLFQPLSCWICFKKHKNVFAFSIFPWPLYGYMAQVAEIIPHGRHRPIWPDNQRN